MASVAATVLNHHSLTPLVGYLSLKFCLEIGVIEDSPTYVLGGNISSKLEK